MAENAICSRSCDEPVIMSLYECRGRKGVGSRKENHEVIALHVAHYKMLHTCSDTASLLISFAKSHKIFPS